MFIKSARMSDPRKTQDSVMVSVSDSLQVYQEDSEEIFNLPVSLPDVFFMPPVYDKYSFYTPLTVAEKVHSGDPAMRWIEDYDVLARQMQTLNQTLFFNHPELVHYNMATLPEAPKQYITELDPSDFSITIRETVTGPADVPTIAPVEVKKKPLDTHFPQTSVLSGLCVAQAGIRAATITSTLLQTFIIMSSSTRHIIRISFSTPPRNTSSA